MRLTAAIDGWEPRELDVLRALTIQIKYFTPEQVAAIWFRNDADTAAAGQLLDSLCKAGLAAKETIEVHDATKPDEPLYQWQPGEACPTHQTLSELCCHLANRWTGRLRPITVFRATPEAANLFGAATVRSDRSCDWSHDFFITDVFLRYRESRQVEARHWFGEAFVPRLGRAVNNIKDPDVFLIAEGRIERVIEIGGKYNVEHLQALHEHCAGGAYRRLREFSFRHGVQPSLRLYDLSEIPYEIW